MPRWDWSRREFIKPSGGGWVPDPSLDLTAAARVLFCFAANLRGDLATRVALRSLLRQQLPLRLRGGLSR